MNPHFEAGMRAYNRQDCARALEALSRVPAADEASTAARFYSGVCLMHEGDLPGATHSLRGVADAGDSPQQEAAFYYLAQVSLAGNDAVTARRYLARTISLRGDLESRARSQLAHVPRSDAGQ
jgi:predicted Zn-dependent protease